MCRYLFFLILVNIVICQSASADSSHVEASTGSIAVGAGDNATINATVNNIGFSAEQIEVFIKAATSGSIAERDAAKAKLAETSKRLELTENEVLGFFETLGRKDIPPEKRLETLNQIATKHIELLGMFQLIQGDDPTIVQLKNKAEEAIKNSDYDRAESLMRDARTVRDARRRLLAERELEITQVKKQEWTRAAGEISIEAGIKLAELDYEGAIELYEKAFKLMEEIDDIGSQAYWLVQIGKTYYSQGTASGENKPLEKSITSIENAIQLLSEDSYSKQKAGAQVTLGNVLQALGERENKYDELKEAEKLYRLALDTYKCKNEPQDWLIAKSNLGVVLVKMGSMKGDASFLRDGLKTFEEKPVECQLDLSPAQTASMNINIGTAWYFLAKSEENEGWIEKAIKYHQMALVDISKQDNQMAWFVAQNMLASDLEMLSKLRGGDQATLEKAIASYKLALDSLDPNYAKSAWATVKHNLGMALISLAIKSKNETLLDEALENINSAGKTFQSLGITSENIDSAGIAPEDHVVKAMAGLIEVRKAWPNNAPLKVCFFDGKDEIKAMVALWANEWARYAPGLTLDFGERNVWRDCNDEKGDIRIAFKIGGGSWSYIGTDAKKVPSGKPTVNFDSLDSFARKDMKSTILHEFGHAFSVSMTHIHPRCVEELDWDKVYAYFGGEPNHWPKEQVDRMFGRHSQPIANIGIYDPYSVMSFPLERSWFKDPSSAICAAQSSRSDMLSRGDIESIATLYPGTREDRDFLFKVYDKYFELALKGIHAETADRYRKALNNANATSISVITRYGGDSRLIIR